jgi:hypothetical protein
VATAEQRYRLHSPGRDGLDLLSSAALAAALFAEQPACRRTAVVLCYCPAEECPLREVRVTLHDPEPPAVSRLPRLRCPGCGGQLEFRHYLKTLTLVPDDPEED